jgi:hypothetical protein
MTANFAAVSASLVASTFALVIAVMADLTSSETATRKDSDSEPHIATEPDSRTNGIADAPQVTKDERAPVDSEKH